MRRLPSAALAELTRAFLADLPAAWQRARDRHPDHTPYAFVLHGHEGAERPRVWPVVLSNEGLTQVAQRYVDRGYHDTLDEAREALRWSVPDAPDAYEWADGGLPRVIAAVERLIGTDVGDAAGYQMLADAAVPAWQQLDAAGTFGTGADRNRLLLGFMLFDVAEDDTLGTVPLLNPPAVVERYRRATEPAGFFQSVSNLAASPDGRRLYTVGTTHDPAARPAGGTDSGAHEVVAYAVAGPTLLRQWSHRYPAGLGDELAGVAIDPSDDSVVVLWQQRRKGAIRAGLVRYPADSADPVASAEFEADARGRTLIVSPDGRRIAVAADLAVDDDAVLVFDRQLARVDTVRADARITAVAWLAAGRLLVCTGHTWRVIDPASDATLASLVVETDAVAVAADGSAAAVTRRPWRSARERLLDTFPQVPTPAAILSLPDLTVAGTITVPGLILHARGLSADGRTLIAEADHLGSKRQSLVALDVPTGRELARRRPPLAAVPRFLPDGRTVALGKADNDGRPPVEFWTVRD